MNRLKMNMKEEVEHSNPLKGLSQKTSIIVYIKIKKLDHDDQKQAVKIVAIGSKNTTKDHRRWMETVYLFKLFFVSSSIMEIHYYMIKFVKMLLNKLMYEHFNNYDGKLF